MSLKDRISADLKGRMKAKDALAVGCIRLILAAIKNREIDKRGELTDAECAAVLSTLAKQRGESIDLYRQGGRQDLVDKESAELRIVESYLPEQLAEDELMRLVEEIIAETGAVGAKDIGMVMKALMPRVAGCADGKRVSDLVKLKLTA